MSRTISPERELISKVGNLTTLSSSEQDKVNLQQKSHEFFCSFLMEQVQRVGTQSELLLLVEKRFRDMIMDEDVDIPLAALLKLYEILKQAQATADSSLIGLLQKNPNIFINVTPENISEMEEKKQLDYDQKDIDNAKELLKMLNDLKKSEGVLVE